MRAAGSGHSFTDAACTDGVMLDLARMDQVLDSDRESGLVRVQPGITLHELGKALAARIAGELMSEREPALAHDSSTNALIRRYRTSRKRNGGQQWRSSG